MIFVEGTSRDALGDIVIRSKVKSPPGRMGFEKMFWPGVEVGLQGWERAYSQGNITGHESQHGIRYAPREVNQHFQRLGIEKFIRELYETNGLRGIYDMNIALIIMAVVVTILLIVQPRLQQAEFPVVYNSR